MACTPPSGRWLCELLPHAAVCPPICLPPHTHTHPQVVYVPSFLDTFLDEIYEPTQLLLIRSALVPVSTSRPVGPSIHPSVSC